VTRPKIIHISVIPTAITLFTEHRQAELERIFGQQVKTIPLSPREMTPNVLGQRVREIQPDAVVLSTGPSEHRQAVKELADEIMILHPVHKRRAISEERWRSVLLASAFYGSRVPSE
jgi:hypothetical protein